MMPPDDVAKRSNPRFQIASILKVVVDTFGHRECDWTQIFRIGPERLLRWKPSFCKAFL